ncbi:MAG: mycofactocin-associated electron transfer flavoprotein beta subunit, partial [Acidimicrobiales bacterium]
MTRPPESAGAVVACLRVCDLHPEVDPLTGAVRTEVAGLGLSHADAAALEHTLRAAEIWAVPAAAVTAGPPDVDPVLRDVAALGVSVLRIDPTGTADADDGERLAGDERRLAQQVAEAIVHAFGRPRLVVCGDRSADRGTGAFPGFLAHELGAAQALGLVTLTPIGPDTDAVDGAPEMREGVAAERRLDAGWRERLFVPLPAVCSVEGAGVQLRRAGLDDALGAAALSVRVSRTPASSGSVDTPRVRIGMPRPFSPRPRIVPGPAAADPRLRVLELCGALEDRDPPVIVG